MKTRYHQYGFTLIEILVAAAIIVSILSMIFGTYFVSSKSTQVAGDRMIAFQQTRKILAHLTRQIRCSYADTVSNSAYEAKPISKQKKKTLQSSPDYFSCRPDNPTGQILHLITTSGFGRRQKPTNGLFEVTYKFDKSKGRLWLSQERFVGTDKNSIDKKVWRPIAENIESLEFAFFDGRKWLNNWSFKTIKKLPNAVKIDVTFEDQTSRTYKYGTVAYVCCHKNYSQETQSAKLVIAKK